MATETDPSVFGYVGEIEVTYCATVHARERYLEELERRGEELPEPFKIKVTKNIAFKMAAGSEGGHGASLDLVEFDGEEMYAVLEHIREETQTKHLFWSIDWNLNRVRGETMLAGISLMPMAPKSSALTRDLLSETVEVPFIGRTVFQDHIIEKLQRDSANAAKKPIAQEEKAEAPTRKKELA